MSIISECEFCRIVSTTDRTYTKQTELYDGIADVMMCVRCGDAAEFEQKRIIKLLEEQAEITGYVEIELSRLIALIKGETI